jgi:hypothetical protein
MLLKPSRLTWEISEVAEMREVASPILLAPNKRAFSSQN